jgi:nucleoside 2-deoxyribosyltransferase
MKHFEDNRNRQLIEDITSLLSGKGFETINIIRYFEKWGEVNLSAQELMQKTFEIIDNCNIVLIDLTEKGVGLGIEAGYAFAKHKIIITIAETGANISKTLEGISTEIFAYDSLEELSILFDRFKKYQ